MLLGGLVYSAEVVGRIVVEYARHVKSGSYRSHVQIFMLPIAMTTALLQTRQRAKALESSPLVDTQMVTGSASTTRVTITSRDR